MNVEDFKTLESRATPGPWKGRELVCHGQGQATGPAHEIPDDIRTASVLPWTADCRLIALLRNLAPELLELWDAVAKQQAAPEGRKCHSTTLCKAFDALEKKAASMAV